MKNKPHPRWAQSTSAGCDGDAKQSTPSITVQIANDDSAMRPGSSGGSSPTIELYRLNDSTSHLSPPHNPLSSPSSSRSSGNSPSPINTPPSPLALTPIDGRPQHMLSSIPHGCDLSSLLSPYFSDTPGLNGILDGLIGCDGTPLSEPCFNDQHGQAGGHCGCLHDSKSYSVVLELSVRLRRAADILASSPKHTHSSTECSMHQRISALDKFTT